MNALGHATTVVVAVALLLPELGSVVLEETDAVLLNTVPPATPLPTFVTRVKTALLTPNNVFVQVTVPVEPTPGVEQDQPPGGANDTKVVPLGSVSDSETEDALLGPALFTVMV